MQIQILNMRPPAKDEHAHANKEEEEAELFVAAVHRMRNCLGKGNSSKHKKSYGQLPGKRQ